MPVTTRPVRLAAQLVRGGASLVVVGSAARSLREGSGEPRDLDIVVSEAELAALVGALARIGVAGTARGFARARDVALSTAWGPLDLFVGALPPWVPVDVDGTLVRVAVPGAT
jgi:hypothetical protein